MENLIPSKVLKTRQGTVAVGIGAAVLAAILLLVYLQHYRSSVKGSAEPQTVLVAKSLIPRGTAGSTVAARGLFVVTSIPRDQLKLGAITDPALLRGTVAAADVYPRQQLTSSEFSTATAGALSSQLSGAWRAMALPALDSAHGINPDIQAGDHVDIYVQFNSAMSLLLPNILMLGTPTQAAGTTAPATGNYVVRVRARDAARLAFAGQNGQIWLSLRPASGARGTRGTVITGHNVVQSP